jgi:hypothetical protein
MKTWFILSLALSCTLGFTPFAAIAGMPYEVVLVKGKVHYQHKELRRGDKLMLADLDSKENMSKEYSNFTFDSNSAEVHLLDLGRRKIIPVSARINKQGRDLMLATRGIKYIRSDFEFRRAFSPENGVLTLLAEDTLICTGLKEYSFSQDSRLIAVYQWNGIEIKQEIGHNDTLFLTRRQLFSINTPEGQVQINSFDIDKISLLIVNAPPANDIQKLPDIQPFSLYFLNDIIQYYAQVRHEGIGMDINTVLNLIMPGLIGSRQIQREFGLLNEEEARQWLETRIKNIFSQ